MQAAIGVGVAKCATSWLFKRLSEHPQIATAKKELGFFNKPGVFADYLKHFSARLPSQTICEFTPSYCLNPQAILRIKQHLPQAKLLVLLRNPVDRAFSAYKMAWHLKQIPRTLSFLKAWQRYSQLKEAGQYPKLLARVYAHFLPEQVLVLFYDDVKEKPRELLKGVFSFLGVDPEVQLSGYDPWPTAYGEATKHLKLLLQDRERLIKFYKPGIQKLSGMVGRDLSAWLV